MGSERKPLDLETIREREMSVRDPRMYQPETIRALYLNDVTALSQPPAYHQSEGLPPHESPPLTPSELLHRAILTSFQRE